MNQYLDIAQTLLGILEEQHHRLSTKANSCLQDLIYQHLWSFDEAKPTTMTTEEEEQHYIDLLEQYSQLLRKIKIDINEDFLCCHCNKPVYSRILYCSKECSDLADKEQTNAP